MKKNTKLKCRKAKSRIGKNQNETFINFGNGEKQVEALSISLWKSLLLGIDAFIEKAVMRREDDGEEWDGEVCFSK